MRPVQRACKCTQHHPDSTTCRSRLAAVVGGLGVPGGTVAAKEGTGYNTPCEQTRNVGFIGTKICGEQDAIWRAASPALSQFSQYSVGNTNPSHWFGGQTSSYASGVVTPIAGPDGFTDAGQASQNIAAAGTGSQAVSDGDIVIAFSMWRAPSGLPTSAVGGLGNPTVLCIHHRRRLFGRLFPGYFRRPKHDAPAHAVRRKCRRPKPKRKRMGARIWCLQDARFRNMHQHSLGGTRG